MALGVHLAIQWCLLFLKIATSYMACGFIEACNEIVRCSGEEIVRGIMLIPWGPRRATLVEHVIEIPHLW